MEGSVGRNPPKTAPSAARKADERPRQFWVVNPPLRLELIRVLKNFGVHVHAQGADANQEARRHNIFPAILGPVNNWLVGWHPHLTVHNPRVQPNHLLDDGIEVRQPVNLGKRRNRVRVGDCSGQLGFQLCQHWWVGQELINGRGKGESRRSFTRKNDELGFARQPIVCLICLGELAIEDAVEDGGLDALRIGRGANLADAVEPPLNNCQHPILGITVCRHERTDFLSTNSARSGINILTNQPGVFWMRTANHGKKIIT